VTAFASFDSAVEAMKLGAVDYLPIPLTPEQVRTGWRWLPRINSSPSRSYRSSGRNSAQPDMSGAADSRLRNSPSEPPAH